MSALLLAAGLFALQPAQEPAPGPKPAAEAAEPEASDAWPEAVANRGKVKVAPKFTGGPRAVFPEAEKALGHHGPVLVEGMIGTDVRMTSVRVKRTSHAPVLDQIAVDAALASTFTPAKDADGAPLAIVVAMPFDLVGYKSEQGMGVMQYTCDQFVREMDWWKSLNPDKPFKDHELYKLESGMALAAAISQTSGNSAKVKGLNANLINAGKPPSPIAARSQKFCNGTRSFAKSL